jgi:(p)ppGpp synthase/HD superfamily hydrolase
MTLEQTLKPKMYRILQRTLKQYSKYIQQLNENQSKWNLDTKSFKYILCKSTQATR